MRAKYPRIVFLDANLYVPEGWHNIVEELFAEINDLLPDEAEGVHSVPGINGDIWFKWNSETTQVQCFFLGDLHAVRSNSNDHTNMAAERCMITCQVCGAPGQLREISRVNKDSSSLPRGYAITCKTHGGRVFYKKSVFSVVEIVNIVRALEAGKDPAALCREYGLSKAKLDYWRYVYGGLEFSDLIARIKK